MSILYSSANSTMNTLPSNTQFSTFLISHLKLFCSFIRPHPLYLSFFVFFFSYLLKIVSFLSPLFITTSLFLVALLTLSLGVIIRNKFLAANNKVSTLLSVSFDDESEELFHLENFEAYRILFEESLMHGQEGRVEFLEEKSVESLGNSADPPEKDSAAIMRESRLEDVMKQVDEFENMAFGYNAEDEKVEGRDAKADKVVETQRGTSPIRNGSKEAIGNHKINNGSGGKDTSLNVESWRILEYNLGSHGFRRKEREWKRTLACKLYEERHQTLDTSGEGMDLLWETYEMDTVKSNGKHDDSKKKMKKKCTTKQYEKDSDNEEEAEMDEQLCCLQALKINSGIGRHNLMKLSKAIKGFGWLQNVSKHSKKVHGGDYIDMND